MIFHLSSVKYVCQLKAEVIRLSGRIFDVCGYNKCVNYKGGGMEVYGCKFSALHLQQ